jgi:hypothetical protein
MISGLLNLDPNCSDHFHGALRISNTCEHAMHVDKGSGD